MRVTTKGQVTIPVSIRERFGLLPNTEVDFEVVANGVRLRKARGGGRVRTLRWRSQAADHTLQVATLAVLDGGASTPFWTSSAA